MASIKKNPLVKGFKGMFGESIVFKTVNGKPVAAMPPSKGDRKLTPKQEQHKEKFTDAVVYAKAVYANPTERQEYESGGKGSKNAYRLAVTDFMNSPVVKRIDNENYKGKIGDQIIVRAKDDFKVKSVKVQLFAADGSLVEEGQAVLQLNNLDWLYTVTTDVTTLTGMRIVAIALDKPNNKGILEVTLA